MEKKKKDYLLLFFPIEILSMTIEEAQEKNSFINSLSLFFCMLYSQW